MNQIKGFAVGLLAMVALAYGGYRGMQGVTPVSFTVNGAAITSGNRLPVNDMTSFSYMGGTTTNQTLSSTWTALSEGTYGGTYLAGYILWNSGAAGNSDALVGTTSGSPIYDCPPGSFLYIPYSGTQTLYAGCLLSGQTTTVTVTPVGY